VKTLSENQKKLRTDRILVLRYSSLGDVILTNPVLDLLKKAYPEAEIMFATKCRFAPMVAFHPAVTRTILLNEGGFILFLKHLWEILSLNPMMVLDLHDSLRTKLIRFFLRKAVVSVYAKEAVQRRLIVKKLRTEPSLPTVRKYLKALEPWGIAAPFEMECRVHVSRDSQDFTEAYLNRNRIEKSQWVVGLGPGASWKTKQWPPEYYAQLASRLVEKQKAVLIWFGSQQEADLIRSIQSQMTVPAGQRGVCAAGELSLEQTGALLSRCGLFAGNDSGLVHLASGRGVPVAVLYGSTTPSLGFEPWGKHRVAEVSGLNCRPCDVHGRKKCPLGHFKCMRDLTVDSVEQTIGLLAGGNG
jgi:heptosyltransferase-2